LYTHDSTYGNIIIQNSYHRQQYKQQHAQQTANRKNNNDKPIISGQSIGRLSTNISKKLLKIRKKNKYFLNV